MGGSLCGLAVSKGNYVGVSAERYGGADAVTMWQYSTFLSRAIRGNEEGIATGSEVAESELNGFTREAAVGLSVRALSELYMRDSSGGYVTTAAWLCRRGVFTAEELRDASLDVLPSSYVFEEKDGEKYLWRAVAGQPVAMCPEADVMVSEGSQTAPLDYLHASGTGEDGTVTLYILDCKTMEVLSAHTYTREGCKGLNYVGSVGDVDYLIENIKTEEGTKRGALMRWDGKILSEEASAAELWEGVPPYTDVCVFDGEDAVGCDYEEKPEGFVIDGRSALFTAGEAGVLRFPKGKDTSVLGWDGEGIILQSVSEQETVLSCVSVKTGETVDEYRLPQDMKEEENWRTVSCEKWRRPFSQNGYYYGEAGLYRLQSGRLAQITDLPAVDMIFRRYGAGSQIVFLSHEAGIRMHGGDGFPSGNLIFAISPEDGTEQLVFECLPEYGLDIAGFVNSDYSSIQFYAAESCGMQHYDVYTYAVLEYADGTKLWTISFEAGRPEMLEKAEIEYVWDEMDRLYAVGIGDVPPPQEARQPS